MVDAVHPQATRIFQIHGPVIYEDALFSRPLRYGQSDAKDGFFRFAGVEITGAEKSGEVAAKVEGFDAVVVQLQRLVIDRSDKILAGARGSGQDRASFRVFPGLGKHEGRELFAGERMRTVEKGAVKILVKGDLPGVESGKSQVVAILKVLPIQLKSVGRLAPRFAIPAIGKNDATDIPKERCNTRQGNLQG